MDNANLVCDCCGKQFKLSSVGIKTSHIDLNEGPCDVVFFNCPSCKRVYLVSVQDVRWTELKTDLDKQIKRQAKMYGRNSLQLAKLIGEMISTKKERLVKHVAKLKSKYDGRFTLAQTDNGTEELKLLP